ncbi:MAG TPA: TPM domain-containing protein [Chitinophagales bacterium]|nr:TPM domain-containing protein [Chitinophagales bacterium]
MSKVKDFFKNPDAIVQAIKKAELKTSGEIKVHIEAHCPKEVMEQAKGVFHSLKMDQLPYQNGVLIYLSVEDKKICILGDKNIDLKTGLEFWNETVFHLSESFKNGFYDEGVITAVLEIGRKLQDYFPFDSTTDNNDLNDDISYG